MMMSHAGCQPVRMFVAAIAMSAVTAVHAEAGDTVYKRVCQTCHGMGVANAPKFGDRKAWDKLIQEPQEVLTAHGYVGVRGMPAKGGDPTLTVDDFARATAYMARAAGATWKDPDAAMLARIRAEIAKREQELAAASKAAKAPAAGIKK